MWHLVVIHCRIIGLSVKSMSGLIEDVTGEDEEHIIDHLVEVYSSWMDDAISNYNSDFYYQSRDYIYICYKEGKICE